jgi:hypothetical protein
MIMETIETTTGSPAPGDAPRAGRLIARIGSASILRGQDGFLDVQSDSAVARNAALAWMFSVSPAMVGRVRRCGK